MNRRIGLLAAVAALALAGCKGDGAKTPGAPAAPAAPAAGPATAQAEPPPEVARAKAVFGKVGGALGERLTAALTEKGAPHAIDVCKREAAELTAKALEGTDIRAGRTSHKLRNPANAAPEWLAPKVAEAAGKRADQVGVHTVDLGDRLGVAAPIPVMGLCTSCHGSDEAVTAETRAAIAAAYPSDAARGFEEGDLRGWFWAEVPKEK